MSEQSARRLIAIAGPTGVGKSRLGLWLAGELGGEIVSADSRQVYRYMDIGTAKPTREERSLVRHHVVDIITPDEEFSLAEYQRLAFSAIDDIHRRGGLPFLVGGSGLYLWAVLEGWQIPRVAPDNEFRRSLERQAAEVGGQRLYEELVEVDPVAAESIDARNVRRVIRALEVARAAPGRGPQLSRKQAPPFESLIIGLTAERAELYRLTDKRVDAMIERGLVDEVRDLLDRGYGETAPVASGIGYRLIAMFLRGELSLAEAVRQMKTETHRLVRHQYAWFRRKDERIRWFDVLEEPESDIRRLVRGFIGPD